MWWFTSENMVFVTQLETISMYIDAYSRLTACTFKFNQSTALITVKTSLLMLYCHLWYKCNMMILDSDDLSNLYS